MRIDCNWFLSKKKKKKNEEEKSLERYEEKNKIENKETSRR